MFKLRDTPSAPLIVQVAIISFQRRTSMNIVKVLTIVAEVILLVVKEVDN